MRDYWLTKDLLQATGIAFVVLSLIGIALALWLPKKWWGKLLAVTAVAFLISIPVRQGKQEVKQLEVKVDDFKVRYAKAKALFDKRCETAGEKIYRTVEGVEGLQLMNIRPQVDNFSDQFALTDPYGHDYGGDGYIASFLWGRNKEGDIWEGGTRGGFRYVDVIEATTNIRYRYTASIRPKNDAGNTVDFLVKKETTTKAIPAYGVIWQDISTKNDRDFWIAGGAIKVVDLKNNEVIGERIGFMMDAGQGNTGGERSPWLFAQQNACPQFPTIGNSDPRRRRSGQINRSFIESILKPKQGE